MEIAIKCPCGNTVTVSALHNKTTMLRDYLDINNFGLEAKNDEVHIFCKKCRSLIILSLE